MYMADVGPVRVNATPVRAVLVPATTPAAPTTDRAPSRGGRRARRVSSSTAATIYTRDGVRRVRTLPTDKPPTVHAVADEDLPQNHMTLRRRSHASLLGEYQGDYLGFSLGRTFKNVGRAVKKGVKDAGHVTGKVVTSKLGQMALGTALAVTGVGMLPAAGIFAASKGVGNLIKPGGNLKRAATGAAQGAVEGVVSSGVGSVGRKAISAIRTSHAATGAAATQAAHRSLPATAALPAAGIAAAALPVVRVTPTGGPAIQPLVPDEMMPPEIGQMAPIHPKAKRVKAAGSRNDGSPLPGAAKFGVAKKVLAAGSKVKENADKSADRLDALTNRLDAVQKALDAAQALGDTTGANKLSELAAQLSARVEQAQNVAGTASSEIRTAGDVAQGAAAGAVGGGAMAGISDFVSTHKALVYGGGAALALTLALMASRGTSSPRYARN